MPKIRRCDGKGYYKVTMKSNKSESSRFGCQTKCHNSPNS